MIGKKRYAAALQAYRDAYYASPNVSEAMESALEAYEAVRDTKPESEQVESLQRKLFSAQCVMDTMQDGITFRDNRITELEKAIREARELVNLGSFEFAVEELTEAVEANK